MAKVSDALELHREAIVIDGLNASVLDDEYLDKLLAGGVTAVNWTVAMNQNVGETVKRIADVYSLIRRNRGKALLVTRVDDIYRAKREGKVGIILGFQNIAPLEGRLDMVDVYHRLGVRIIQLTYHFRNEAGDGCLEPSDSGLSLFGRKLVRKLNDVGIVIDLAHVGRATSLDAVRESRHPVIASHSNVRALVDTYQNKSDEEIVEIARKGGVIGVTAFPRLLGDRPGLSVKDMVKHIDYIVDLVGVDHVGIGTDLAEGWAESPVLRRKLIAIDGKVYVWPEGIRSASQFPNITAELLSLGYSEREVKKILGENFLRVFKEVFK